MVFTRRRVFYIVGAVAGGLTLLILYEWRNWLKYLITPLEAPVMQSRKEARNLFEEDGKSLVAAVQGTGDDQEISSLVRMSVDLIGGVRMLDVEGKVVLVKPNVNSDDPYPATTNPLVVKHVVKMLLEAGASEVVVGDMSNPAYSTEDAMKKTGIWQAALEGGAKVRPFDRGDWFSVEPKEASYLRQFIVSRDIFEADLLVNIPALKTHSLATYSMSLKNFVGAIHPRSRSELHRLSRFEEGIAEINLAIHPDLTIIDGTRSMVSGGPFRGTVKETNLIIAGGDRVALDAVGLSIVKKFGLWERVTRLSVWDQRQIRRALELGIGRGRDSIKVICRSLAGEDAAEALNREINEYLR